MKVRDEPEAEVPWPIRVWTLDACYVFPENVERIFCKKKSISCIFISERINTILNQLKVMWLFYIPKMTISRSAENKQLCIQTTGIPFHSTTFVRENGEREESDKFEV